MRSPDSDVFVILISYFLHISSHLYFDTGVGNNRRLIDVNAIANAVGLDVAKALPGLH